MLRFARTLLTAVPPAALVLGLLLAAPSHAQDQTLILRFGVSLVENTTDGDLAGRFVDLGTRGGLGVNFEWMFHPRVGLEFSNDLIGDIQVEWEGDYASATTFSTLMVGLNVHPVRNARFDWGIGAFVGGIFIADWRSRSGGLIWNSTTDSAWGAQTFVDISMTRRWAIDLGVKYYEASVDFPRSGEFDYNPVILRAMGVVRW